MGGKRAGAEEMGPAGTIAATRADSDGWRAGRLDLDHVRFQDETTTKGQPRGLKVEAGERKRG